MKKALVLLDGRITEVRDDEFPVHPDLKWVDVPDDTVAGWDRYENQSVVKYAPPPMPPRQRTIEDMLLDYVASRPDASQEIKDEAARRTSARPQVTPTR